MLLKIIVSILFGVAVALIIKVVGGLITSASFLLPFAGVIGVIAAILYFIYGTFPTRA